MLFTGMVVTGNLGTVGVRQRKVAPQKLLPADPGKEGKVRSPKVRELSPPPAEHASLGPAAQMLSGRIPAEATLPCSPWASSPQCKVLAAPEVVTGPGSQVTCREQWDLRSPCSPTQPELQQDQLFPHLLF